jgi:DNA-binding transcriptional ArsR family regulator
VPTASHTATAAPPRRFCEAAIVFGLLSAPVRLHILWLLASGDQDVSTLADATSHSVATVSHHLGKLKAAGIVSARRIGRRHVYVADDGYVVELVRLAVERQCASAPQPEDRGRGEMGVAARLPLPTAQGMS